MTNVRFLLQANKYSNGGKNYIITQLNNRTQRLWLSYYSCYFIINSNGVKYLKYNLLWKQHKNSQRLHWFLESKAESSEIWNDNWKKAKVFVKNYPRHG